MQGTRQIKQIVAQNIASRRAELGWSRRKLALEADGLDPMSIYKWERGMHRPQDDSLTALAQAMDRDVAWFYTDHDEKVAA